MNISAGGELPIPFPTRRQSTDATSIRSSSSRVKDKEKEKARLAKASKESIVLLALEKEENKRLNAVVEEYRKANQDLLRRAEKAERDCVDATSRVVKIHNARVKLTEDVERANSLVQQYRVQLDAAKAEIRKADQAIQKLSELRIKERDRAERWKAKYVNLYRALASQKAFDEGRKEGYEEGFRQARGQAEYASSSSGSRISTVEYDSRAPSFHRESSIDDSSFSDVGEPVMPPQPEQTAPVPPPPAIRSPSPPPVILPQSPPRRAHHSPTPQPPPSPPPPSPPQPMDLPPQPVSSPPLPIRLRNLNSNEQIRPVIIQHHPNFQSPPPPQLGAIPPDGFIPCADPETQHIPVPHQHELSHHHFMSPQMPEPVSFPEPEPAPQSHPEPDPRIIPPPGFYRNTTVNMMNDHQYRAAQSSPESASTTLSLTQMEIVNTNPNLRRLQSPMSTIMEAPSGQATPNVMEEHTLPRKPSLHSISGSTRSRTPSNFVPTNWTRPPSVVNEAPRVGTPSSNSSRGVGVGRKSSVKSVASSARGHSTGRSSVPPVEPQRPSQQQYARSAPAPPPPQIYTRPTPPPQPPQIYNIYAPPSRMNDIREEEERRTPTMPNNRPLAPEQRAFSPRQDDQRLHVDLPPPPNTGSTLADDVPTPSSMGIGIDVVSPTPPESVQEEPENPRTIREFLSPQDATRPLPMETTQHSPAPSAPPVPPMNMMSSPQVQTMPDGAFFMPMSFTPQPSGADAPLPTLPTSPGPGFVPQSFTPSVPPNTLASASSPRPSSPRFGNRPSSPARTAHSSGSNMPGGLGDVNAPPAEEPPVIPSALLLQAVQNTSDSDDESGMNSEANTLTTPPSKVKGLPSLRGGANARGGGARGRGGKKKKK
ncbi:hypothetical protein AAF712_000509 [Marasmius tenuissimus]|uniref:Uncharacterized protein n=1 Tax=Marasmius tenuissimus TaxID=585030 RepID=A0ABR3AFP0_9AGAR